MMALVTPLEDVFHMYQLNLMRSSWHDCYSQEYVTNKLQMDFVNGLRFFNRIGNAVCVCVFTFVCVSNGTRMIWICKQETSTCKK